MLWLALLGLPAFAAAAVYGRYFWYPRWRHRRCLANTARLEREYGELDQSINRMLGLLPEERALEFKPGAVWPVESHNYVQVASVAPLRATASSAHCELPVRATPRREIDPPRTPQLDVPMYLLTGVPIVH
jgi:hypothetical protein